MSVDITIDNKPLSVPEGTTIMEAATNAGIAIPHFCWHPGLSIAGVCRFCMVKVAGMPKLQIACNTIVQKDMVIDTVSSDVKEAHKWALEFHLINHPLDCPICDQAGECGLQNYYMKVGKYTSQMTEKKVLKPKALDVGDTLVLDTERCILCSRCVRFEDEVTKTQNLGIFQRGDDAIIGTYQDRRIEHNYSYNLADICPVGAFTSKDFRFKCRVWFLEETPTVCPGCSTGCSVTLFQNSKQREYHRLKPRYNPEINDHWMCDKGRMMYEHLNVQNRLAKPVQGTQSLNWNESYTVTTSFVKDALDSDQSISIVLTPQLTSEEYETIFQFIKNDLNNKAHVYIWRDSHEDIDAFDGLLYRGDHNSNTRGLENALTKHNISAKILKKDFSALKDYSLNMIFGPEINFESFLEDIQSFSSLQKVIYFGNQILPQDTTYPENFVMRIPQRTFIEKDGSFTNYKGITQKTGNHVPVFTELPSLSDFLEKLWLTSTSQKSSNSPFKTATSPQPL